MSIINITVITGGILLIGFIYWFFFGSKNEVLSSDNNLNIIVEGGYKPSIIKIKNGKKAKITFLRKDTNSCLEEVYFPDFKIKEYLPLNEKVQIKINPQKEGEFEFHCSMNMFHGKVIVI